MSDSGILSKQKNKSDKQISKMEKDLKKLDKYLTKPKTDKKKLSLFESQLKKKKNMNKLLIQRIKDMEIDLKREKVQKMRTNYKRSLLKKKFYDKLKKDFVKNRNEYELKTVSPHRLHLKNNEKLEFVKTHCFCVPKIKPEHDDEEKKKIREKIKKEKLKKKKTKIIRKKSKKNS